MVLRTLENINSKARLSGVIAEPVLPVERLRAF